MTDVITYGMGNGPLGDLTMSLPPSGIADLYEPLMPEPGLIDLVEDATLVRDVMHGGVIVCNTATPLLDVAKTMLANNIHAVVVVAEDEMAAGVVSQTDLVLAQQGRSLDRTAALTAGDVMTPGLVSCTPDRKLSDAVTLMTRNRIHRLVVVEDQAGKLAPVGILSMTDVVRRMISEN